PVLGDARIVDQDVNTIEFGLRLFAQGLHLGAVRKVCREDFGALAKLGCQGLKFFDARSMQADNCSLSMQHPRDLFAYPAGCSGHQGLAAGQIKHGHIPFEIAQPRMAVNADEISAGVLTAEPDTVLSIRRASPVRTLPAPTS